MKFESQKLMKAIGKGRKILIYDTETTGLDKIADVIVEYSAIVMEKVDGKYRLAESFEQYIRPKFRMSESVIRVHGITNEFLEDYPYEEEAYKSIKAFLERHKDAIISGYNQRNYDDAMMYNLALRQGDIIPEHPEEEIDIYNVVKENIFEKNRKLSTMHGLLCPEISNIQFHNSSDDIKATWNVAVALYKKLKAETKQKKSDVILVKARWFVPGAGKSYLFLTTKDVNSTTFYEIFYDTYYKTWKSKEIDIDKIDTDKIEEKLLADYGEIKKVPEGKFNY